MRVLKTLVRRLRLENRLRHSPICQPFWRWKQPDRFAAIGRDRQFFHELFDGRRSGCIFDVGANVGDKAVVFADLADRVVCVEPDPHAAAALRIRLQNRPGVIVEQTALGSRPGELTLYRREPGESINTLSERFADHSQAARSGDQLPVPVTTLDVLINRHGPPDFLKVDVEGFELEVFRGLSAPLPLVCFEALVPIFLSETVAVIELLECLAPGTGFTARLANEYRMAHAAPVSAGEMIEWVKAAAAGRAEYSGLIFDIFAFAPTAREEARP
jgi:FkbM family methyltransferase